jgi:hypothetical protein
MAERAFSRLRDRARVHRYDDARYQPRLHDMRHYADSPIMLAHHAGPGREALGLYMESA